MKWQEAGEDCTVRSFITCTTYASQNIVDVIKWRRIRWAGHVARMGEMRRVYNILVGKSERKRPLGRPSRRRADNITMDLR
jgi:hypothetical protein